MFCFLTQVFIILLSFSSSLACVAKVRPNKMSELCMVRPTLIDFNPVELKGCLFMISLDKRRGSCNVLSPKSCVLKKKKDVNVKIFNKIANKNKARIITKHLSCERLKMEINIQQVIQIKIGIKKHVNLSVKIVVSAKKIADPFARMLSI